MSPFLLGVIAGYGIAIPVGAIAVLILDTGIQRGLRSALAAGAGAAAADLTYASLAAFAGGALAPRLAAYEGAVRLVGGAVLLAIGAWRVSVALRPPSPAQTPPGLPSALPTFFKFLGLTLLNPLTIVYFAALVFGGVEIASPGDAVGFAAGAGLASLSWQWLLAALGALGGRHLPRGLARGAGWLGTLIVLGLGARLLLIP